MIPTARSVVVSGASSGLGTALAQACAAPGVHLALTGRDAARLGAVAAACASRAATVAQASLDVRDAAPLAAWLAEVDAAHPVDLLVVNAGIPGGSAAPGVPEAADTARAVFATNLDGALNLVHPLLPGMAARGAGRIVLVSSLAALAPLPDYPAYSGSKAALLAYGLALREGLRRHGVSVTVACPGFIATPMGEAYGGRRPFEMSAAAAARRILAGAARDKAVNAFPKRLAALARVGATVPEGVRRWGMGVFGNSGKHGGSSPDHR